MRIKFWLSFVTSIAWAALVIAMFLALAGCAVTEESEYREQVDKANWLNCESAYARQGKPTYHDHLHERAGKWEIRSDLSMNNCRRVIGDEWLEY